MDLRDGCRKWSPQSFEMFTQKRVSWKSEDCVGVVFSRDLVWVCAYSYFWWICKPSHRSHTIIPLSNHHTIIIPKSHNLRNYMDVFNHEQYLERWWWWCIQSKYGDTYRKKGTHSISFHEEVKGYDWYLYIQRRNAFCWECWELGVFFTKVIKHISKIVESVESLGTYRYIKCTIWYQLIHK